MLRDVVAVAVLDTFTGPGWTDELDMPADLLARMFSGPGLIARLPTFMCTTPALADSAPVAGHPYHVITLLRSRNGQARTHTQGEPTRAAHPHLAPAPPARGGRQTQAASGTLQGLSQVLTQVMSETPDVLLHGAPDLRALLVQAAALAAALKAAVAVGDSTPAPAATRTRPTDRLLTATDAATLLGRSVKWLSRNKGSLPFTVPASGRHHARYSERGIQRWIAEQRS